MSTKVDWVRFGADLKAFRIKFGHSLRDVASETGVGFNSVRRIEEAAVNPRVETFFALCKYMGRAPQHYESEAA